METLPPTEEVEIHPPESPPLPVTHIGWTPRLNKTQDDIFNAIALHVLAHGEKGSGKTFGGLHALVRHCYEEKEALALIIAPQIRTGKEGVIYDLEFVLDVWRNGNKDREGNRIDSGMGLNYTEPSLDPHTKDRIIWIGNRHGTWSKVILVSIPYREVVEKRMKALSPSFVYVDEITELDGPEYFTFVTAQLGRRRGIIGPQQYYASCNPSGPSHWVYKIFFDQCINQDTGQRDPAYEVFHVPVTENLQNLPEGYIDKLFKVFTDPIDQRRLLQGEWVDRPTGDAIYKNYFKKEIHVRPPPGSDDFKRGLGLLPLQNFPVIVGVDPGPANFCVVYSQMIPIKGGKNLWLYFDEQIFVGQYKADFEVVKEMMERREYWNGYLKGQSPFHYVTDEASFTHMRPDGSYDAYRIAKLSAGKIRMRACPGHRDSRPARSKMLIAMLWSESTYISARCNKLIEAVEMLESEKVPEGKYDAEAGLRPKRSKYIHPWDAMTYPPYYFQLNPSAMMLRVGVIDPTTGVFRAGGG